MNNSQSLRFSAFFLRAIIALCVPLCWHGIATATSVLQVAVAADLAPCIDEINNAFSTLQGGSDIRYSIGSSGNFFAQIKNGAPFEVFLSADMDYPRELAKARLADPASLIVYANGQLVMWSNRSHIDVNTGFASLFEHKVKHIALSNPTVSPYGRAAKAALEKAGIWNLIQSKLVIGDNIAQTAQFVQTGHADIGFVGITHAKGGALWRIPSQFYPLLEQGAIVTTKGRNNPLAAKYVDFLRSDAGQAIFLKYGFTLPAKR